MNEEFITIAEAAKLLGQSDAEIMRRIKERLEKENLALEAVMRKEKTPKGVMYVINKAFLLGEPIKNKNDAMPTQVESLLIQAKDEMIKTLKSIIETKDKQIADLSSKIDELIERDRETNILLKGLQDRLFLLESKSAVKEAETNSSKENKTAN